MRELWPPARVRLTGRTLRHRRARWTELQARTERAERDRDQEARRAVTEERLRIARELHDVIAHSMSVIAVQSAVGNHVIDTQPGEARQALVRGGFRVLVDSAADLEVVGEAGDGTEAVALARKQRPDVILMDIRMPHLDGLEATRVICGAEETGDVRVLILTTFDLDEYVYAALRAGASGFLLKDPAQRPAGRDPGRGGSTSARPRRKRTWAGC